MLEGSQPPSLEMIAMRAADLIVKCRVDAMLSLMVHTQEDTTPIGQESPSMNIEANENAHPNRGKGAPSVV